MVLLLILEKVLPLSTTSASRFLNLLKHYRPNRTLVFKI